MELQGTYTNTWCDNVTFAWDALFGHYKGVPGVKFLEIGSYEGRSTAYLAKHYLTGVDSKITCIDTFEGSMEHTSAEREALYQRFLENIRAEGIADQTEVKVGTSSHWLPRLIALDAQYDVVYIDGSHIAADVMTDAALAMQLLKPGGVLLFDDYAWDKYPEPELNPRLAIDAFCAIWRTKTRMLHRAYQVALLKL